MVRLQTPRLALDELTLADADFMLELLNDPDFMLHVGDRRVRTRAQAAAYLQERVLPSYAEHGFGMYAVRLRDGGEIIGLCGLVDREGLAEVDIGYAFLARHRGAGYALEAARRVLEHAANELGMTRVVAIVTPTNTRSIALLEALGMVYESMVTLPDEDVELRLYSWTAQG